MNCGSTRWKRERSKPGDGIAGIPPSPTAGFALLGARREFLQHASPLPPRLVYWLSSVLLAWLLMQAVHECGHVLGAWLTGGRVAQVVLHPLAISRTDVSPNPKPLIEVWAGPLFGALFPVLMWLLIPIPTINSASRFHQSPASATPGSQGTALLIPGTGINLPGLRGGLVSWLRFFAGFCLIANGCYLGYGVIEPIGDAEELVRLGSPVWLLGVFGLITVPSGLRLWHGLGAEFGLGPHGRCISWAESAFACGTLLFLAFVEWVFTGG